jgi:MFS transporter, DHA1 family, tetracycline resistance protein
MSQLQKKFSFFLILVVAFIDWVGIGLVYPMFSSMLFQRDCLIVPPDTSDTVRGLCLGVLLAVMPTVLFFSAPLLGTLSDRLGRRPIIIYSLVVALLGYLVAMVGVAMESFVLLLFSRVVIGVAAGSGAAVEASVADVSTPQDKAKNFGLFNMACGLGFVIGPFLGGKFSESSIWFLSGYSVPFLIAGIAVLANLLLIIWGYQETYISGKPSEPLNWALGLQNIKKALNMKGLRFVFLSIFIACAGWSFYWEFIPVTWINENGFSTSEVGNLYAFGAAIYALSCGLLIRPIVKKYQAHHVLFYGLILNGIAITLLFMHTDPLWLLFYIALQQYAVALFFPTSTSMVSNWVDEHMQGEILGVLQSVQALALAATPLLGGVLLGIHVGMPIIVGGVSMFLSAAVLGIALKTIIFPRVSRV